MNWTHAHIGTGKFGLGFVGYFSNKSNSKTMFLNRLSHEKVARDRNEKLLEEKSYLIEYYNKEIEDVKFDGFHFYDRENLEDLINIIAHPETTLLTTSVGYHHLPDIAPYIEEGLRARKSDCSPLFVLACENGHRSSSHLKESINQAVIADKEVEFLDCVVDQICDKFSKKADEQNKVVIQAENYREWIIEERNPDIRNYLNHAAIKFIKHQEGSDSPLELYEVRKRWLVNGLHMAVAIIGTNFMNPDALIADVIKSKDDRIKKPIDDIKNELADAFRYRDEKNVFTLSETEVFINDTLDRFMSSPDRCERIVKQALHSSTRLKQMTETIGLALGKDCKLSESLKLTLYEGVYIFFEKVQERIYEPIDMLKKHSRSGKALSFLSSQLVPFMVKQGKNLMEGIRD
jgi:mannitol-1-phosphate/altronate dehydrogenase